MENEKIIKNYKFAKFLENKIISSAFDENLILFFTDFVVNNSTGCYFYQYFEDYLINIASKLESKLQENKIEKSLIIMTEAYVSGGHTRIVEHTINNSKDNSYDLLFTRNDFEIPASIVDICHKRNSNIIILDSSDAISKAVELRKISSAYKKIIMHIHPEDFLPILSFGIKDWDIPIFLYNHAEHRTWFCNSIVDIVMDLSQRASNNTKKLRMIDHSEVLDIPIIQKNKDNNKNIEIRKFYNIPKNAIVFSSAGDEYKFTPNKNIDFKNVVSEILENIDNSYFCIIGISLSTQEQWNKLKNKYKHRLIMIERLPYRKYEDFYNVIDIYINSMPVGGFTVLLEAAIRDIPIIFLNTLSSFPKSIETCGVEYNDILKTVRNILYSNIYVKPQMDNHFIENFIKKHNLIISSIQKHSYKNLLTCKNIPKDFSTNGYTNFIFSSVYKNKHNFNHELFSNLSDIQKVSILYKIFFLFKSVDYIKLLIPKKFKKIIKKIIK